MLCLAVWGILRGRGSSLSWVRCKLSQRLQHSPRSPGHDWTCYLTHSAFRGHPQIPKELSIIYLLLACRWFHQQFVLLCLPRYTYEENETKMQGHTTRELTLPSLSMSISVLFSYSQFSKPTMFPRNKFTPDSGE